jgi:Leucine-rich repeat (LRR) protein
MNLIPKSSEHIEGVRKSIDLTNKLLQEIENKITSIDDNYMVLIPDGSFRNYLKDNLSISFEDSYVSYYQIKQIREINTNESSFDNICSLSGLQYFSSLEKLVITYNNITKLDVSNNSKLSFLNCSGNPLKTIDLSKNLNLTHLNCYFVGLTNLDLSKNIHLQELICGMNRIENLDISKNTQLLYLNCEANLLTNIDVSKNTLLAKFECDQNQLSNINLTANSDLNIIVCCDNNLKKIEVSKNIKLVELSAERNELLKLDLTQNNYLQKIKLKGNPGDWWLDLEKNPFDFWNSLNRIWKQFLYHQTNNERPEYFDYMNFSYSLNDHLYGMPYDKIHDLRLAEYEQDVNLWLESISEKDIIEILNLETLSERAFNGCHQLNGLYPISRFKNIKVIDITCHTNDLTPLTNLTNLTDVTIIFHNENDENDENDENSNLNISPISNLFNIVNLSLSHFRIIDFACLSNLKELETLDLQSNKITDINQLTNIIIQNKNLSHIRLMNNLISDISPLFNIPIDKEMLIELNGNPIDENQYLNLKKTHEYLDIHY